MKTVSVLFFALLSLGFIIDTPEARRERELQHKAWRHQMGSRYDFPALRKFVAQQIKAIGRVEGIDLSKSTLGARWSLEGGVAQCGDWRFMGDSQKAEFTLSWTYADIPNPTEGGGIWKIISLHCVRKANDRFEFRSASRSEDEYVILSP
jgi:hypothetical protein